MHEVRVLKLSPLYAKMTAALLIGDFAYPLSVNLLAPHRYNGHLTAAHTNYNIKFSGIRSVIERAVGTLKGKFRKLKYIDVPKPQAATLILSACCMLLNFILTNGDEGDVSRPLRIPEFRRVRIFFKVIRSITETRYSSINNIL